MTDPGESCASGPSGAAAILPAFNEADRIAATLRAVLDTPGVTKVIVVDDGSSDSTSEAARSAGAHQVLRLRANRGKGAALNAAWRATEEPVLLFLDADLGATASEAVHLLEAVCSGRADMAIATLPRTGKGGGLGITVRLARWGIQRLTGRWFSNPLSGQRCLRRVILESIGGLDAGFGVETGLTIDAIRAGFRVEERETQMAHRVTGRDLAGILHRGRQLRDISRTLLKRWWKRG